MSPLLSHSGKRSGDPNSNVDTSETTGRTNIVDYLQQVANEKKMSRSQYLELNQQRNLELKRLIYNNDESSTPLIAVKVSVDQSLRKSLAMNGREKRGRMFLKEQEVTSIAEFKHVLHSFFRTLLRKSYILRASLPDAENDTTESWPLETDQQIVQTINRAKEYFEEQQITTNASWTRPTFLLHISQDPNYLPPSKPTYLDNMPNPLESPTMTMISFYSFFSISQPEDFVSSLKKIWRPFHVLGRVYVAEEGINAQMAVPTNVLKQFELSLLDILPNAKDIVNIDPIPLDKNEFIIRNKDNPPPFTNLHIRIRPQVVADGLDESLDLNMDTGYEMSPVEWHETLLHQNSTTKPILLDCRNHYETDVGRFVGAEPLNTESFRESWGVLKERLKDVNKDAPILTYCTGGIRCVKVGAYLSQELGFTNVSRLAGGIIAYDRTLMQQDKQIESLFKGTNYVFDNRVGRQITTDALGTCITCGGKTHLLNNCKNSNCHKRMVQCIDCSSSYLGTCSDACKQRVLNSSNGKMIPLRRLESNSVTDESEEIPCKTLDEYSDVHSSNIPPIYAAIEHNTKKYLPTGSHMVSGAMQGRLLYNLASMAAGRRILEIGTFTGYATSAFLEGCLASTGNNDVLGTRAVGPFVLSLERDQRAYELACAHINIISSLGVGAEAASEALNVNLEKLIANGESDHIKKRCFACSSFVGCEIQKTSDALATIEQMALGVGENSDFAPFDIVFIDADKTRLLEYADACLTSDRILRKGGLMIVDNTLYKGVVLEHTGGISPVSFAEEANMDQSQLKRSRRAYKLAGKMHAFNKGIANDNRCEVLILPIRDGLSMIRKK